MIEFIISGKSVPNAKSTKPIRIGGIFQLHASAIELSTALSLERVRRTMPNPKNNTGSIKSIILIPP